MVSCIKSGCDVTDKRYGPVIQPFVGKRMITDSQNGWKSSLPLAVLLPFSKFLIPNLKSTTEIKNALNKGEIALVSQSA